MDTQPGENADPSQDYASRSQERVSATPIQTWEGGGFVRHMSFLRLGFDPAVGSSGTGLPQKIPTIFPSRIR